jgi:hypothetical protein
MDEKPEATLLLPLDAELEAQAVQAALPLYAEPEDAPSAATIYEAPEPPAEFPIPAELLAEDHDLMEALTEAAALPIIETEDYGDDRAPYESSDVGLIEELYAQMLSIREEISGLAAEVRSLRESMTGKRPDKDARAA